LPGEVARLVRLDASTVRRKLAAGEIRGVKVGRGAKAHWRIPPGEAERFLREGARGRE
jgi:excisionase family DNA binding protein